MAESILVVDNVTKTYPGVKALDQVSLEFRKGEIHALVGENGAGKSTIIKTIAGAIKPDSGSVLFDGKDLIQMKTSEILSLIHIYAAYGKGTLYDRRYLCVAGRRKGRTDRRADVYDVTAWKKTSVAFYLSIDGNKPLYQK